MQNKIKKILKKRVIERFRTDFEIYYKPMT